VQNKWRGHVGSLAIQIAQGEREKEQGNGGCSLSQMQHREYQTGDDHGPNRSRVNGLWWSGTLKHIRDDIAEKIRVAVRKPLERPLQEYPDRKLFYKRRDDGSQHKQDHEVDRDGHPRRLEFSELLA